MINNHNWNKIKEEFCQAIPYNHVVIDNFFDEDFAKSLALEFPEYNSEKWHYYHNPLEDKKTCNHWDSFPKCTYQAFSYLTDEFSHTMRFLLDDPNLRADQGLHGGGWHVHSVGGKNNIHLDYNIHPKLNLQRKLNIIIYMTPDWKKEWNGGLEIWDHDYILNKPNQCVKTIENRFNRAIIFDTTQNSWHGIPIELKFPEGVMRRSLAVYYITNPEKNAEPRKKALFAPYGNQENDPAILELIKKRSDVENASGVYKL